MPPLVRRRPLTERIKAHLDPYDFLLWLSEELNDDTYDDWLNEWATPIGIALNILFVLARGASIPIQTRSREDVFGDTEGKTASGWFAWGAAFLVHLITLLCCVNAFYTFFRQRQYRLFEQPVDITPVTPSARRVRVDSSPASSSPLQYLHNVISKSTASSRAYPDAEREVWEVSVWDPKPFHLTIFTLFSPGHLLLYFSLLPPATLDARPSITVLTAITFGILLSLQLGFLKTSFSQQAKDSALIHGEVMNEYDTKFVHPSLNRPVRDVGIQTRESAITPRGTKTREVDIYTPTTIVNRGFRTNPNPNYSSRFDLDSLASKPEPRRQSGLGLPRGITTPSLTTPINGYVNGYTQSVPSRPSTSGAPEFSSPLKPHHERLRERSPAKGDGGSMGVYSHAASPLRKAASSSLLRPGLDGGGEDGGRKGPSPLKRTSAVDGRSARLEYARRRETGQL